MATTYARPVSYGPSSAAPSEGGKRFGGAFGVSLFIHGTVAATLLFFAFVVSERPPEPVKIFDIVAGEGNDYMAKEAPSGHEAGLAEQGEVAMPTIDAPPNWTPPADAPTPVAPVPPTPVAAVEPPKAAPEKPVPNLQKTLSQNIKRQERKAEKEIKQQRAEDAKREAAEAARQKSTSYAEWQKQNANKTNASNKTPSGVSGVGPRLDPGAVKKGVTSANGAGPKDGGGNALTSDGSGPALDRYLEMMRGQLKNNHEKPGGLSDLLSAEVEFTLNVNGTFSGVRITRSSGNKDFDYSVLEAFGRVRNLGPRPDGKSDRRTLTFKMRDGG